MRLIDDNGEMRFFGQPMVMARKAGAAIFMDQAAKAAPRKREKAQSRGRPNSG